jgi:hypothetical protein
MQVKLPTDSIMQFMGQLAFSDCSNFQTIALPTKSTTLDSEVFCNGSKLCEASLRDNSGLETIGFGAFANSGLETMNISPSVTIIDRCSFCPCLFLSSVTFAPKRKLQLIGSNAFSHNFLNSITISASIAVFDSFCFVFCSQLETIEFAKPSGARAFLGCPLTEQETIQIPDAVTELDRFAFALSALTAADQEEPMKGKLTPKSQLKKLSSQALMDRHLSSITLRPSIEEIGEYCFADCPSLTAAKFHERLIWYVDAAFMAVQSHR